MDVGGLSVVDDFVDVDITGVTLVGVMQITGGVVEVEVVEVVMVVIVVVVVVFLHGSLVVGSSVVEICSMLFLFLEHK